MHKLGSVVCLRSSLFETVLDGLTDLEQHGVLDVFLR